MPDPDAAFARFSTDASAAGWTNLFPALCSLAQDVVGHRLFTCSVFRLTGPASGLAARVFTSDQQHYPLSGLKDILQNRWTDIVIQRQQIFVANEIAGITDVFPDHALIASLGLGAVINLPVVLRGAFVGTVNLLHDPGFYTTDRLKDVARLTIAAQLAFGLSGDAAA